MVIRWLAGEKKEERERERDRSSWEKHHRQLRTVDCRQSGSHWLRAVFVRGLAHTPTPPRPFRVVLGRGRVVALVTIVLFQQK